MRHDATHRANIPGDVQAVLILTSCSGTAIYRGRRGTWRVGGVGGQDEQLPGEC